MKKTCVFFKNVVGTFRATCTAIGYPCFVLQLLLIK